MTCDETILGSDVFCAFIFGVLNAELILEVCAVAVVAVVTARGYISLALLLRMVSASLQGKAFSAASVNLQ